MESVLASHPAVPGSNLDFGQTTLINQSFTHQAQVSSAWLGFINNSSVDQFSNGFLFQSSTNSWVYKLDVKLQLIVLFELINNIKCRQVMGQCYKEINHLFQVIIYHCWQLEMNWTNCITKDLIKKDTVPTYYLRRKLCRRLFSAIRAIENTIVKLYLTVN